MALFRKKTESNNNMLDDSFIQFIKALDKGEKWAKEKYQDLLDSDDPYLFFKMDQARIIIYSDAAKLGDIDAQYWLGFSLRRTDKQESLKWLIPLAENGDIDAMIAIALGYTEFGGFGDDPSQYRYWYMKAAEAGSSDAQAVIGLQYYIDGNYDKSLKWYNISAKQKNSKGAAGIAKCYSSLKTDLYLNKERINSEELKKMEDEYDLRIENAYIDAANWAVSDTEFEEAFSGLGWFYKNQLMKQYDLDIAKRAAYFFYSSYLCGNDYSLSSFNEINNKYNLQVDTSNIDLWADREELFK